MTIGDVEVTFHRTVRVADGRQPSNLPPSLGRMELFPVKKYAEKCPERWERDGFFVALHDTEAMWMSFSVRKHPVALLVGAGGINALTGEKLGTTLQKDNYLVTPPQPWLDGWKDQDGTVYQFVATPYKEGKGITVAEQLIGEESKTGALGLALFDPKEPGKMKGKHSPYEGWTGTPYGNDFSWTKEAGDTLIAACSAGGTSLTAAVSKSRSKRVGSLMRAEMGIGKGGKIIQKIYSDPFGLEVWKEIPTSTQAVYLVNAKVFEEITGLKTPDPVGYEGYHGPWFGMKDSQEQDVTGTGAFTGLKSAVFPDSKLDVDEEGHPVTVDSTTEGD